MTRIEQGFFEGERPLFAKKDLEIFDTVFSTGESPLKECENIELYGSSFRWKYPLWYCNNVVAKDCVWFDMARAGVWYTKHISLEDCQIEAPKNFRRSSDIKLKNVSFKDAAETLWQCVDVSLENVFARGDYFLMNSENVTCDGLTLYGNYSFDGAKNVRVKNSRLLSKDSFWNSENVTVENSFIAGEYLGWNSKNLTLVNCTIESLQGLCYADNLKLVDCKLICTDRAFEYSTVDATVNSKIDSVLDPTSGRIVADDISKIVFDRRDPKDTEIVVKKR